MPAAYPGGAWQGCSPLIPPCAAHAAGRGGEEGSLSLPPPSPSGEGERGKMLQGKVSCLALCEDFLPKKEDSSKAPRHVAVRCHLCLLGHLNSWWEVSWQVMSQGPNSLWRGVTQSLFLHCAGKFIQAVLPAVSLALLGCECSPCWAPTCPWGPAGGPQAALCPSQSCA